MYCLTVLEARSPRSRYWRVWFLLRPFPMICRCLHSPHLLPVRKDSQSFFSCKCTSGVSLCVQTSSSYKDSHIGFVVVVQLLSHVWLSVTPRTVAHQASLSFTISWNLLKLMSIKSVMLCNHLILCHLLSTLFSSCLQSFPASGSFPVSQLFSIRHPKYWSFSFSISTSNEYSELISLRIDWFDLLAVQGTLKSLLQHHNSKASIIWHSTFFMVQLSHLYMTTGKTIALTIWTFVSKVMSLLFNTLSRFVKTLHHDLILT